MYHKFGSNEKANNHGLHLLRGDFDEVRENERQMKKWKEFIQVESGAYRLDAWPLITINEFLEKKIEIWHESRYENYVGKIYCTTTHIASGKGATEY